MASLKVNTNIGQITGNILAKISRLKDNEYMLRPIALDSMAQMKLRIHEKGIGSDGLAIGQYSPGYMRQRQKKYKRTSDTKVIISLTRQLEDDYAVIATQKGYGIGFLNKFNLQKARWVEQTYGKQIFSLTTSERDFALQTAIELTNEALK